MMKAVKRLVCGSMLVLALLAVSFPAIAFEKIDLNTATVEQLVTVKGIGAVLAQRIVDYRHAHNGFKSLKELDQVKGVGSKTLEKLLPSLTLNES